MKGCPTDRKQSAVTVCRVLLSVVVMFALSNTAQAVEPVTAVLEQDEAWAGEPVRMIVTLYSPGPFSGTPSFDLPELPSTAIIRTGRPLVGSETIDGDSWFTQRHELDVFTQQTGDVTIPSFLIRFEGKKTFTSQPEPMQGVTPDLTFQSRRPPGTSSAAPALAATALSVTQTWTPDGEELSVQAGDVVQRTVLLEASGTTAMMLPSVPTTAPEHVRVYESSPEVQEKSGRGQSGSVRQETIRYQFQQPGTYELPGLEFAWWDYEQEEQQQESLGGLTVNVTGRVEPVEEAESMVDGNTTSRVAIGLLLLAAVAGILYRPLGRTIRRLKQLWNAPEAVAGRRVIAACRANDAQAAYAAVLAWNRLTGAGATTSPTWSAADDSLWNRYQTECRSLANRLFSAGSPQPGWNGQSLQTAFSAVRRQHYHRSQRAQTSSELPPLNPISGSGR